MHFQIDDDELNLGYLTAMKEDIDAVTDASENMKVEELMSPINTSGLNIDIEDTIKEGDEALSVLKSPNASDSTRKKELSEFADALKEMSESYNMKKIDRIRVGRQIKQLNSIPNNTEVQQFNIAISNIEDNYRNIREGKLENSMDELSKSGKSKKIILLTPDEISSLSEKDELENDKLLKFLKILQDNYQILATKWKNLNLEKSTEEVPVSPISPSKGTEIVSDILAIGCWIWLIDYNRFRLYLLNKISEAKQDKNEKSLDMYKKFLISFSAFFPFKKPNKKDSSTLLIYEDNFHRRDMVDFINDRRRKNIDIFTLDIPSAGLTPLWMKINISTLDDLGKSPYEEYDDKIGYIEMFRDIVSQKKNVKQSNLAAVRGLGEFGNFGNPYKDMEPQEKKLYTQKSYFGTIIETLEDFEDEFGKVLSGGVLNELISLDVLNSIKMDHQDSMKEFIQKTNNKFKDLCEEYCIECEINKKIDKLKMLFKIDGKNETDIFKKHNISIRDLNLYV